MTDREQRIRQRAYELWEVAGKPEGREAEHWAEAERQLAAEDFSAGNPEATDPKQTENVETVRGDVPLVRKKRSTASRKQAGG